MYGIIHHLCNTPETESAEVLVKTSREREAVDLCRLLKQRACIGEADATHLLS